MSFVILRLRLVLTNSGSVSLNNSSCVDRASRALISSVSFQICCNHPCTLRWNWPTRAVILSKLSILFVSSSQSLWKLLRTRRTSASGAPWGDRPARGWGSNGGNKVGPTKGNKPSSSLTFSYSTTSGRGTTLAALVPPP